MINLHLKTDNGEQILFVLAVENLTPEQIHVEIQTAIFNEEERQKELKAK